MFPELTESEDEVIRKELLNYLYDVHDDDEERSKWIAWLEKQGEQRPVEKPTKGNYYTCIKDYQFCEHDDVTFEMGKIYKCEEDGKITADNGGLWPFSNITGFFRLSTHEEITSHLQKPVEWSEEDEKGLGDALWCCKQAASIAKDENDMGNAWYAEKWLNSIKDRVQPQPKQEWSDEDTEMIDRLIRHCKKEYEELCNDKYGHQEIVSDLKRSCRERWDWLESLKNKIVPQSHWKPTEEQIKALRWILNNIPYNIHKEEISGLLEQIQNP